MSSGTALKGKHAFITGGGHGIGGASAEVLAASGAILTLTGRNMEKLEAKAARLPGAEVRQLDVTDEDAVKRVFAEAAASLGAIDILINNSGIAETAPFMRTSSDMLRRLMEVNLIGAHICTQQVLPAMIEAGWGRIVNISSLAGISGQPYIAAYCASKHAMVGLTRALALEVAKKGITVNAVCPAYVETGMVEKGVENIQKLTGMSADDARGELAKKNPQARIIEASEVGATVGWLCLPGSESITGQSIAMAGGAWM
ncbi:MAG: SDR family NAD(P)-dependent oxidoreductase [Proteobacteria bacterium]|nr:SDR family NAD(P)-dependent oxidoreductase [Pseudomonadota bacterium]MDA1356003.1 SDR family NAD(P)-dependent oxidoreductase [Pseudomonadota bacterium]